jgi:sugar lactone lactonase YvrE
MTDVACVVDSRHRLGECPVWDTEEKALYWWADPRPALVRDWTAPYEPVLHRLDPATGVTTSWQLPEPIGSFALRRNGGIVAASRSGFAFMDLRTGAFDLVASPEKDRPGNRLNDGRCDRRGRFWAGSMAEDLRTPDGALFRLDADRRCHRLVGDVIVSNGLAWSPDDKVMYHADSSRGRIWAWDFDLETGAIGNRRVFAEIDPKSGIPDGAAVDGEGCYWSACFRGWRLVRYAPDGREIRTVKLPVQNPTMCAFGGERLDVIYVTSAALGLTEESRKQQPQAGGVFALDVGVSGLPEPKFVG